METVIVSGVIIGGLGLLGIGVWMVAVGVSLAKSRL